MAKSTRSRVRGGKAATDLASDVVETVWGAGGNQVTILAIHSGSSALTLDVELLMDASDTDALALERYLGAGDVAFPLPEETVGTAASGVIPITVSRRRYTIDASLLGGALPAMSFPISGSGPCKIRCTWSGTSGDTIAFAVLTDNV